MRWRFVPAVLALLLSLAGCNESAVQPTVVTVWFHSGQGVERAVLSQQIKEFNADHVDVQVELAYLEEDDYSAAVSDAAAGGSLPCILDIDGPALTGYVRSGWLTPLDDLAPTSLTEDLLPTLIDQGTVDGVLYALGTFDSGLGLWANARYLAEAGVRVPTTIEDAWTFEEFEDALRSLQALPDVEYAIDFKLDYGVGEWFTYGLSPLLQGFGGDLVNRDTGQAVQTLDGAQSVAGLRWFDALLDQGLTRVPDAPDDFEGSQITALSWSGHWTAPPYRQGLGEDLLLLPVPHLPARQATGMGSWQWGVTSACDAPEDAWAFLEFLLDEDQVLRTTEANGAVPARRDANIRSAAFTEQGDLRIFVDQLEAGIAVPRPAVADYPRLSEVFAEAVQQVVDGADPARALHAAAVRFDDGAGGGGR